MGQVNSKDRKLFQAINDNNEMAIRQMLALDPDLAARSLLNGTTTPLCRAVFNDYKSLVLIFLENGADINGKALKTGRTPLMWAAFRDNLALCQLLISKGADIEEVDNEGLNCFDIAVIRLQY